MAEHLFEAALGNLHAGKQPVGLCGEQCRRMLATAEEGQRIAAMVQAVPVFDGVLVQTEESTVGHTGRHALEAQRQGAFGFAGQHSATRHLQGGAARGAAIAEIEDWHTSQAYVGQDLLATPGLAMHAGREHLVDQVVVDARIFEYRASRPASQRCDAIANTQGNERCHPHPRDQHAISHNPYPSIARTWDMSFVDQVQEAPPVPAGSRTGGGTSS
ncbi:hypothetical protein FQZ97_993220 [compost metagenome]